MDRLQARGFLPRTAVLYGIFGNVTALRAVAEDARGQGVRRFVCMGDSVAAGPDPVACLQWVVDNCAWWMHGFWDRCLADPSGTQWSSKRYQNEAVLWSREQVLAAPGGEELIKRVNAGKTAVTEDDVLYVYGSVRDPMHAYLQVGWGHDWQAAEYAALPGGVSLCIGGRMASPCICRADGSEDAPAPAVRHNRQDLPKPLIVVGGAVSAGSLSRDGDPRASYIVLDNDGLEFRRVEYDVEKVVAEVQALKALSQPCRDLMMMKIRHS